MFRVRVLIFVLLLVLLPASVACADVIAPFAWLWPGVVVMNLPMAVPATVLAAFLERPFVSRLGIQQHALRYSLRANFLSLLGALPFIIWGWELIGAFGLFFCVLAVILSIMIEGWYLRHAVREAGYSLRWGWVIAGNLLSSGVLMGISAVASTMLPLPYRLFKCLLALMPWLLVLGTVIGIAALVATLWPIRQPLKADIEAKASSEITEPSLS